MILALTVWLFRNCRGVPLWPPKAGTRPAATPRKIPKTHPYSSWPNTQGHNEGALSLQTWRFLRLDENLPPNSNALIAQIFLACLFIVV